MIEARGLTKRYDARTALDDLTLKVAPGEIVCLLGPNGAGKTTAINLFLGFVQPTAGQALVKGVDVATHPIETKRSLAYIPEQVALYRTLTGEENLKFFASLSGAAETAIDVRALFDDVGLQREAIGRRVDTYSKGMRQKVAIAIAMATGADVFLLDEPTSGLDQTAAHEFSRLLLRLRARGATILMATHDLYRAKAIGDRVAILAAGRLMTEVQTTKIEYPDLESLYLQMAAARRLSNRSEREGAPA
jgi:ABC-2 type transport system ATP-binding protein